MKHAKNSQYKNYLELRQEASSCHDPDIKRNLEARARERFKDLMPSFSERDLYEGKINLDTSKEESHDKVINKNEILSTFGHIALPWIEQNDSTI